MRRLSVNKNRTRLLFVVLVVLGGGLFLPSEGVAQPDVIFFNPEDGSFGCGETHTVDLLIESSITDLRGFSLVLEFDPTFIQPLSVTAGSLVTGAACPNFFLWINPTPGLDNIAVDGATLGCSVGGPGSIISITFEGYMQGISTLGCREGLLREGDNAPIPFDCVETTVDYRCPVANEKTSWGSMKVGYR